jgi:hypothetical protein
MLLVTANDYAFTGMTPRVSAGWVTIRMRNAGKELHMFAVANVPRGLTSAGLLDSVMKGKVPRDVKEWGGPNAVEPGDVGSVTVSLPVGSYIVGCFVTAPDGKTHFMKGMMGSFEVVAAHDSGTAPVSDRNIMLSSYRITMDGGALTPGSHTFRVINTVAERHDFVILKLLPGHTVAQALHSFANYPAGTAAAEPVTGTTALHLNQPGYVQARFTPGTYILVCWMWKDNKKPHIDLGMSKVVTVSAS